MGNPPPTIAPLNYKTILTFCTDGRPVDPIETLLRADHDAWLRRSDKWHAILDRERSWLARGISAPVLFGAFASVLVALAMHMGWKSAPLIAPLCMATSACISWRANAARMQLESGKADECWAIADTLYRQYAGLGQASAR